MVEQIKAEDADVVRKKLFELVEKCDTATILAVGGVLESARQFAAMARFTDLEGDLRKRVEQQLHEVAPRLMDGLRDVASVIVRLAMINKQEMPARGASR